MAEAMKGCVNAPSEADSYERASAFLSDWFHASLLIPPTTKTSTVAAREPQHHPQRSNTSRNLSRRDNFSNDGNINSLVNHLNASLIMMQEQYHHNQSHDDSRMSMNQSPLSVDEVFHDESVSSAGGSGPFPTLPFHKQQPKEPQKQQLTSPSSSGNPSDVPSAGSKRRGSRSTPRPRSSSRHRSSNGRRRQSWHSCDDSERNSHSSKVKSHHGSKHRNKRSSEQPSNIGHCTGEDNKLIQPQGLSTQPIIRTSPHSKKSPLVEKKIICKRAVTFNDTVEVVENTATPKNDATTKVIINEEKKKSESSSSNRSSKTKTSRSHKKSKSHSDTKVTSAEGKHSTAKSTNANHATSSAQRPLDRLSELDGPIYDLGDKLRNPKHQIIEPDPSKALSLVARLHVHDFAWILRSSREWTYAIVADFPEKKGENASILFVIDKSGNTKTLKMKHWVKCVRLVDEKI